MIRMRRSGFCEAACSRKGCSKYIPSLGGCLLKILAPMDQIGEPELVGQNPLGMLGKKFGDDRHRVCSDVGWPSVVDDVGPADEHKQSLLGRIEKMPEEIAVFVPARRFRTRRLPRFVRADSEVYDKVVGPPTRFRQTIFATNKVANGIVDPRGKLANLHLF